MFTGIIEETGSIRSVKKARVSASFSIAANKIVNDLKVGDSINTNGVCLTVTSFDQKGFEVDVMAETMRLTNLAKATSGTQVNLERALRLSDRLGGHMVNGHIDGTGKIESMESEENATWITITTDPSITKYIVKKGSVAIDGISLTVVDVKDSWFSVSIIPQTGKETTLLQKKVGDILNIENDISAKYIEKFLLLKNDGDKSEINQKFLFKHGFID